MPHTGPSMAIDDAPSSAEGHQSEHIWKNARFRRSFLDFRRAKRFCVATLLLVVTTTACHPGNESTQYSTNRDVFPLDKRTGWFHGPCFAITDAKLARGTIVDLVLMGDPQRVLQVRVGEQVSSASSCAPLNEDRRRQNAKPGTSFYGLEGSQLTETDMGIGIVGPPQKLILVNGLVQTDLNSDGRHEVFSSCATTEGINFAVSIEKPNQGIPLWSKYYYLGYDMKPTCP